MKLRLGFVSNSSSSSFVCQICGAVESGWDATPEEVGFVECPNGHIFCEDEKLDSEKSTIKKFDNCKNCHSLCKESECESCVDYHEYGSPVEGCPICQFVVSSKSDIHRYLKKKYNISEDEVFQIIKGQNKRRRKLYDAEYVTYVYCKFGIQEDTLLKELKEEFGTYSNFLKSLRS